MAESPIGVELVTRLGTSVDQARAMHCNTCISVLCPRGVTEEVDAYYCPNCLENMPLGEAAVFANRCSKCFGCPSCGVALQTVTDESERFFFACAFCRWDSLALGLVEDKPEVLVVNAVKRERESPAAAAVAALVERAQKRARDEAKQADQARRLLRRGLAAKGLPATTPRPDELPLVAGGAVDPVTVPSIERRLQEREQNARQWVQYGPGAVNAPPRYRYDGLAVEREGAALKSALALVKDGAMATSRAADDDAAALLLSKKSRAEKEAEARAKAEAELRAAAEARIVAEREAAEDAAERERLRAAVAAAAAPALGNPYREFAWRLPPSATASLTQRLVNVESQPHELARVMPARVHLVARRKRRCRTCAHIVVQPELKASSTGFEIHQFALLHVPRVRVVRPSAPLARSGSRLVLTIVNPLDDVLSLQLVAVPHSTPVSALGVGTTVASASASAPGSPAATLAAAGPVDDSASDELDANESALTAPAYALAAPLTATASFAGDGLTFIDQFVELAEAHMFEPAESALRRPDAPALVLKRLRNKIWLSAHVTVDAAAGPDVRFAFDLVCGVQNGDAVRTTRYRYIVAGLVTVD